MTRWSPPRNLLIHQTLLAVGRDLQTVHHLQLEGDAIPDDRRHRSVELLDLRISGSGDRLHEERGLARFMLSEPELPSCEHLHGVHSEDRCGQEAAVIADQPLPPASRADLAEDRLTPGIRSRTQRRVTRVIAQEGLSGEPQTGGDDPAASADLDGSALLIDQFDDP